MFEFIDKLMDSTNPKSSKIFIALISFLVFIIAVIMAFFNHVLPDLYIYSLLTLIIGNAALEVFQNNKINKDSNQG